MFLPAFLLILSLALPITGSLVEVRNSLITLPLTRRLNFSNGTIDFLRHSKARLAALRGYNTHDRRTGTTIPATSNFFHYTVQVGVGEPPTTYNLIVDTGSSITWVGNDKTYVRTGTSFQTGREVEVHYGSETTAGQASFSGPTFHDTVTLGGGLTVIFFELAVASARSGFPNDVDGILGIGREAGTREAIKNEPDDTIPTFTDYLFQQRMIKEHVVGIFFQPITREPDSQIGELTFGGIDTTKCIGSIVYTHITANPGSSRYWGIDQRITYGETTILSSTAGIVDTGATFLELASDAFEKYEALTGGYLDPDTGLLIITNNQYADLRNLDFHIEDEDVHEINSLTPDAQIWPRSLNTKLPGGLCGYIYLIARDSGKHSGRGFDFMLGHTFIQRFYTVFDSSRSSVGFAPTLFTDAITNVEI